MVDLVVNWDNLKIPSCNGKITWLLSQDKLRFACNHTVINTITLSPMTVLFWCSNKWRNKNWFIKRFVTKTVDFFHTYSDFQAKSCSSSFWATFERSFSRYPSTQFLPCSSSRSKMLKFIVSLITESTYIRPSISASFDNKSA